MDACQPTPLMTITNFVIVISLCAQSNLLIRRVEGISVSSTRVALALACGCDPNWRIKPGRAQAVVPPGGMLQVQQLPPAVIRSPADGPAARRVVGMAALSSSRVTSCHGGAGA